MPTMFDTNIAQTSGVVNVAPPHAVEDSSTADLIGQLGNVGVAVADQAQRSTIAGIAANQKAVGQANVANYTVQLGKIQQAVAQGAMTSSSARSRIRDLRGSTIANNPSLLPQIDSATTSFLSDSGLGSDIVKGTDTEQQRAKIIGNMANDGWNITPDMDQSQQDNLISAWQTQKLAQQQLQITAQQIAVTRGQIGITSDKLGVQQKQQSLVTGELTQQNDRLILQQRMLQTSANQAVFNGANGWTTNFQAKMNNILAGYNSSGKSPADQQAAVDQINLELAQVTSVASKAGIGGDQNVIDQAVGPMKALATAGIGFVTGKIETQGLKDATENAKNSAMLLAIHAADEKSRKILGIAMAAPGMSSSFQTKLVDGAVLQMLGENSQEPGQNPRAGVDTSVGRDNPNYGSVNDYLSGVKTMVQKSNLGTLDPQSEHLLANNITNMASGLLNGNTKAKIPSDYNSIFSFLADPAVNAYAVKHPEVIKAAGFNNVADLVNSQYIKNVEPLIKQEWQQATTPQGKGALDFNTTTSTPYGPAPTFRQGEVARTSVTHVEFTGSGVRFVADNNDPQTQASVNQLNAKVAPIMGNLIKASATLQGTSNYRKVWNENYASWFGAPQSPEPVGGDARSPQASVSSPTNQAAESVMDKATPAIINSIKQVESNGNPDAVSDKGAITAFGIMPKTAQGEFGVTPEELKADPKLAESISMKYLNMQLARFDGKIKLALAAYNGGPTRVAALLKAHNATTFEEIAQYLPKETRDYVPKVLSGISNG